MVANHAVRPPAKDHPLRFRVGEIGIRVECDVEQVREGFRELYAGYEIPVVPPDDEVGVQVAPARKRFGRPTRFQVLGGSERLGGELRTREILPMVEWGLNFGVVSQRRDYLQLHAAAMSRGGRGFLFPGDSGRGKTTLSAALLADGWNYLSDEFALIHPESLAVHPYPKALCIKSGAFEVIRRLGLSLAGGRHYVKGFKGQVGYVNPRQVRPDAIGAACPVRCIVLPRYVAGAPARLLSITREQAAYELLRNSPNRSAFGDQALRIAVDLVAGAECFTLRSGGIDETRGLLRRLLNA